MDLKIIELIIAFIFFVTLLILGSKTQKSIWKDLTLGFAFSLLFGIVASLFTNQIYLLLIASLWILPIAIADNFKEKHTRIYNGLMALSVIWLLLLCCIIVVSYLMLCSRKPGFIIPSALVISFIIMIIMVNKHVFAPYKKISIKELPSSIIDAVARYRKRVIFSVFLQLLFPLLSLSISVWGKFTLTVDTLHWFYSTVCQVIGTLLGIIVMLAIFLLQGYPRFSERSNLLSGLLTRSVEGLCIFYGVTIIISFMGLIFIPPIPLNINILDVNTVGRALYLTIFVSVFGLVFVCITYLILVFFEILGQQKQSEDIQSQDAKKL